MLSFSKILIYLIFTTTEIETLFENIDLSSYYDKTEVDTLLTATYLTGPENLDITNNQIPVTFPLKVNGEIVIKGIWHTI